MSGKLRTRLHFGFLSLMREGIEKVKKKPFCRGLIFIINCSFVVIIIQFFNPYIQIYLLFHCTVKIIKHSQIRVSGLVSIKLIG